MTSITCQNSEAPPGLVHEEGNDPVAGHGLVAAGVG